MARQSIDEFVVAPILRELVAIGATITATQAGSVDQCEAQRIVVRFVRSVFAIGEHSHAVGAACIGQIEPLMRSDFELLFIVVTALDCAYIPVVSRLGIFGGQRKSGFESSLFGFPVD